LLLAVLGPLMLLPFIVRQLKPAPVRSVSKKDKT
jgi:hypothetical protein